MRYKADEPYNEIVGASSGSKTKERGSYRWPAIWIHAAKKHHRCHLLVEDIGREVEGRSEELHCVFIDLEKAYDRVPREERWECMHQAGVSECYVQSIQDMIEGARASLRSAAGLSGDFEVRVGTQPIHICYNHRLIDNRCEEGSFLGHNVCEWYSLCWEIERSSRYCWKDGRRSSKKEGWKLIGIIQHLQPGGVKLGTVYI